MERVEKEKITERKDATKERQEEKQDSTNKQVARVRNSSEVRPRHLPAAKANTMCGRYA
ncbi:hypothetical protein [Sphingobacterium hotanense]|uniref:hypothetical protein n=1 Tax=Sphingobacterium hotanense TaxID=649196 RepID=UPI0021A3CA63|nr:hypothetical protein [Sphingobacterium hotanense]MCT1524478.1 hypothetical protein [Sphingobacterium hotanense]